MDIQIANDAGLRHRLMKVDESDAPDLPADARAAWAREAFHA